MDFTLSTEIQDLQKMFYYFSQKEVKPLAHEIDRDHRFPTETIEKMRDLQLLGIPYPEELGGAGMNTLTYAIAVEEVSRACGSTGIILAAHTSLGAWPIYAFGTDEQKKKYLTKLASGEHLGSMGLTEPNAGSDAAGMASYAEDKGDHYLLNGSKIFITNAAYAGSFVIICLTEKNVGTKGISALILEKGMPGFTVGKEEDKMGLHGSSTCELNFDNVKVPKENLLGKEGEGFHIIMKTLDGGRISIGAMALGIAQGAVDEAIKYTAQRVQFGKRISQFQNTQFELADMQTEVDAARMLVYRAACLKDAGEPYTIEAAMAKYYASKISTQTALRALQLAGGYGYTTEYPFERMVRDAKLCEIGEGTSEIQKLVISRAMGVK